MSIRKRKHGIFAVGIEAVDMIQTEEQKKLKGKPITEALDTVYTQMRVAGNRPRTIHSYEYIFNQFIKINDIKYVEEINIDSIYNYLGSIDVSQRTKLIRLKSTKAVLSKFHNNGWLKERFWSNIQIKVDKEVKKGAKETDIDRLLQLIDKTTFIGFRDACAVKLIIRQVFVFAR